MSQLEVFPLYLFRAYESVPELGLEHDRTYWVDGPTAGQFLLRGSGDIIRRHLQFGILHGLEGPDPVEVILVRPGGFGDLLFLTPLIALIERIYPAARVKVACWPRYQAILPQERVLKYPLSEERARNARLVSLEGSVDHSKDGREHHIAEAFARHLGLTFAPEPIPPCTLNLPPFPADLLPRVPWTKPLCVIQVAASARCRTYPPDRLMWVASQMSQRGFQVVLMGDADTIELEPDSPFISLADDGYSILASAHFVSRASVVIAPDSVIAHIAGALGVPCVALYGPFPWQLRTANHGSIRALSGVGRCAPCFHHARTSEFPAHCPSASRGVCEVLESISPDRVVATACKLARSMSSIPNLGNP